MSPEDLFLLFAASALAGAVNSVAGGGTLLAFPAALAVGLPGVAASATTSVSLTPAAMAAAWAYRHELHGKRGYILLLLGPSILGGLLGAKLLLSTGDKLFSAVVPWMALSATLLILFKDVVWRSNGTSKESASLRRVAVIGLGVLLIAVYSGYFGAGKNIVMLALLTFLMKMTIHEVNALKSVLVSIITSVSSLYFLMNGAVSMQAVLAMTAGSVLGSYCCASFARRVRPTLVRYAVVGIGLSLTGALAYQRFGT